MSKWEGRMATFDQTTSDYSREHMVTFENLGNLIGDISGQLFQQQAIAHIPYYIQKMTGGDVKKVTDKDLLKSILEFFSKLYLVT